MLISLGGSALSVGCQTGAGHKDDTGASRGMDPAPLTGLLLPPLESRVLTTGKSLVEALSLLPPPHRLLARPAASHLWDLYSPKASGAVGLSCILYSMS